MSRTALPAAPSPAPLPGVGEGALGPGGGGPVPLDALVQGIAGVSELLSGAGPLGDRLERGLAALGEAVHADGVELVRIGDLERPGRRWSVGAPLAGEAGPRWAALADGPVLEPGPPGRPALWVPLRLDGDPVGWLGLRAPLPAPLDPGRAAAFDLAARAFGRALGLDPAERALAARLVDLQRLECLARLTGSLAHDLNNLLSTVLGGAELIQDAAHEPVLVAESAQDIHTAALRGAELGRTLLSFSRRHPMQRRAVDLAELLAGLEGALLLLLPPEVSLHLRCAPGLPPARADAPRLVAVIEALVANARDAMPDGGELSLSAGPVDPDLADGLPRGTYVQLTIEDAGTGPPGPDPARAFSPTFTTRPDATAGLGLPMVQGVVRQHGGVVQLGPAPGGGTRVRVALPADEVEAPAPVAAAVLLVALHSAPARARAGRALRRLGHAVVEAGDAASARVAAEAAHLVLVDAALPGGGLELARALRGHPGGPAVVLAVGVTERGVDPRAVRELGVPVLIKPLAAAALRAEVERLLRQRAQRSSWMS